MSTLEQSLGASSDEVFEFSCDSCLTDYKNTKATGHCLNCNQNLCSECIKFHKKLSALRDHVIENKPKIVTSRPTVTPKTKGDNPLTDQCSVHSGELIKFYCNSHQALACNDCISLKHRNCDDVSDIRDISGDIGSSDEFKTLRTDLSRIKTTLAYFESVANRAKTEVIESCSKAVEEIKQLEAELDVMLKELENKILESSFALKNENISSLDNNSILCQDLMAETTELLEDLHDKMEHDHTNRLFIQIKQAQQSLSKMMKQSEDIGEKCRPRRLTFICNEQVTDILSTLKSLGTVLQSGDLADIKVKYEHDINVKSEKDKEDGLITYALFLPDGRICVCDYTNKSIQLMDTNTLTISDQLTVPGNPISATMINTHELAVKIKGDKNLHILSVSPTLRSSRTILLPDKYSGIAYSKDTLLLTWSDGTYGRVDICDMKGKIRNQIRTDMDGSKLFTSPVRICVSPDHALTYVTDYDMHTVVCMNMEGYVISVYKNEKLKGPVAITVDYDGNVYVCSSYNHTIHQLSRTGQHVQIILTENDGINYPYAIAYRSGKLFISSGSSDPGKRNNIKVFSLT